jgi:hypothetical protein
MRYSRVSLGPCGCGARAAGPERQRQRRAGVSQLRATLLPTPRATHASSQGAARGRHRYAARRPTFSTLEKALTSAEAWAFMVE